MDNLGYCCINQTLRKKKVYTSRTLIRRTFSIDKAADLALQNCNDLLSILQWNVQNNIKVFRISSDLFPRITDKQTPYSFEDLSTHVKCAEVLRKAGKFAYDNNLLLSCHPGPFTVLGSQRESVVEGSVNEIMAHYLMAKLLQSDAPDLQFHINFHVGSKFDLDTADRFCHNFDALPEDVKSYIIIENDDKANCWSIQKLYNHIHKRIGVPLTFDFHHSKFSKEEDISTEDEFLLAKSTWENKDVKQETHYSSSDNNTPKHSDYVLEPIPSWLLNDPDIYIHLEVKQKELALLDYRNSF